MVAYASKVPTLKIGKNSGSVIDEARLTREQAQHIIDKMIKFPNMVGKLYNIFFSQNFAIPADGWSGDKVTWCGPYSTLGKISAGWLANWLLNRHSGGGLTQHMLSDIDKRDPDQIPLVIAFETQLSLLVNLPKALQDDPDLTAKCLTLRSNSVGGRVANLLQRGHIKNGHIDFLGGGCYELIWGETGGADEVSAIRHISGVEAKVPAHVRITREFSFVDNHSDADARVEFGSAWEHHFFNFFLGNAFADNVKNDKRGTKALQRLSKDQSDAKIAEELRQLDAKRGNAEILADGQNERKKAACDKARTAMQQRRGERVMKRKIGLAALKPASSPSAPPAKLPKTSTRSSGGGGARVGWVREGGELLGRP